MNLQKTVQFYGKKRSTLVLFYGFHGILKSYWSKKHPQVTASGQPWYAFWYLWDEHASILMLLKIFSNRENSTDCLKRTLFNTPTLKEFSGTGHFIHLNCHVFCSQKFQKYLMIPGKSCVSLNSVKAMGGWRLLILHNQLGSIHTYKESRCLENVIHQIDSKNEWLLYGKIWVGFAWSLENAFS